MTDPDGKPEIVEPRTAEEERPQPGRWKSFRQHVEEYRRLHVLRLLAECPGYVSNVDVLQAGLSSLGQDVSFRDMLSLVDWLAEQGFVRACGENPRVVHLTRLGLDVAEKRERPPGVANPPPGF